MKLCSNTISSRMYEYIMSEQVNYTNNYDHNEQKKNLEIDLSIFEDYRTWKYTGTGGEHTYFREAYVTEIDCDELVCKKVDMNKPRYLNDGEFRVNATDFLYNWKPVDNCEEYRDQMDSIEVDNITGRVDINKYKVTKYLNEYMDQLREREKEINGKVDENYQINYKISRVKRKNQIVEAVTDGIDVGGIAKHIVDVESIEKVDGVWVFSCSNGELYSIHNQLESNIFTKDDVEMCEN